MQAANWTQTKIIFYAPELSPNVYFGLYPSTNNTKPRDTNALEKVEVSTPALNTSPTLSQGREQGTYR